MAKRPSFLNDASRKPASCSAVLYDSFEKKWLKLDRPLACLSATNLADVLPVLNEINNAVTSGLFAAGFVSYEAAPAFDAAFHATVQQDFPLCCFGLFERPRIFSFPTRQMFNHAVHLMSGISRAEFKRSFSAIKACIARGDSYQVNYTHRRHYGFRGDPFSFFLALVREQPTDFSAFFKFDEWAICSVSPELFFMLDKNDILCKPMKGTMARGKDGGADLKLKMLLHDSPKNRAENVMIVDMIRNDLSRIAQRGSVSVPHLYEVEPHATLWQMTSTIRASTQAGLPEIFSALFPCASITGAPKVKTTEIICELEKTPRKIYTGAMGLMKPNRQMQFNVAIRSALINEKKGEMEYGIGSGIVWDSNADDEFDECELKAQIVENATPEFDLLETLLLEPKKGYFLIDLHLARMEKSAHYFQRPFNRKKILHVLEKEAPVAYAHKIRLLLAADGMARLEKYSMPEKPTREVRLKLAAMPIDRRTIFLHHKTTYRGIYKKAQRGVKECDDVILYNEERNITETTICNIALRMGKELFTPPERDGLLPGVFRKYMLGTGKIKTRSLTIFDLFNCDEILLMNAVRGFRRAVLVHDDLSQRAKDGLR